MPHHLKEIPSTQIFLKNLLLKEPDLPNLEYVLADIQTHGIARHGRTWTSTPGNLLISIWIRNFKLPITWIPHWMGVALMETLLYFKVPIENLRLKWPNDLVLNQDKKIAGILCEKIKDGIVVGIGMNLVSSPTLEDRFTGSIGDIAPDFVAGKMRDAFVMQLIENLNEEPSLPSLEVKYKNYSLLKSGDAISWIDLQTKQEGSGNFQRYGIHGELITSAIGVGEERALYSEEIRLKTKPN